MRKITKNYQSINFIGAILWIGGFSFGLTGFYPFAYLGIFGGPILLLIGIFGWVNDYKQKNKKIPIQFLHLKKH